MIFFVSFVTGVSDPLFLLYSIDLYHVGFWNPMRVHCVLWIFAHELTEYHMLAHVNNVQPQLRILAIKTRNPIPKVESQV